MRCVGFRPHRSGSLRGFASIEFSDLEMTVHGITAHSHESGAAWASPPAQAIIKSGVAVKDERGRSRTRHRFWNFAAPRPPRLVRCGHPRRPGL
jgi:hypothetical protein